MQGGGGRAKRVLTQEGVVEPRRQEGALGSRVRVCEEGQGGELGVCVRRGRVEVGEEARGERVAEAQQGQVERRGFGRRRRGVAGQRGRAPLPRLRLRFRFGL